MSERIASRLPEELAALDAAHVMATYARQPVAFVRGEGATLYDADGEAYLDFLAGISVCNAGHCHPRVVEAIREQAGRLLHASNLYLTEPGLRLAERLASSFARRARRSSSPTRARRRTRRRSSSPASTAAAARSSCSKAPSTDARWARCRPRRRRPSRSRSRRSCPASSSCRATT